MTGRELEPGLAGRLALDVYAINSGSQQQIKFFFDRKIFVRDGNGKRALEAEVGGRIIRAATDAFGACVIGAGRYEGDLFLVFRGTTDANNRADWLSDARLGIERSTSGWPVHIGFNHAFKSMLPDIRTFIARSQVTGTVHCVGHSLGGAVATLAADWAATNLSRPVKLYTFGQPRVGLGLFSSMLTMKMGARNIHRVFHTTDPVPMVPIFPYLHSPLPGHGRKVMSENPIISASAHSMSLYEMHARKKTWSDFSLSPPMNTHEDAIKEWLESKLYSDPSAPRTFEWLERALVWLVTKQLNGLAYGLQWAGMGIHTFLDKVAWLLAKGIEVGETCAHYVKLFMKKVSDVLGIKVPPGQSLTKAFFRYLLDTLTKRANDLAMKAIRGLSGKG